ncbi:MAG: hypothetical protein C4540_02425 [Candidatus Omnitrophota bacterium]|jgi:hypothetical protein|nr:MAG: hypothetical protein C4540_02425 [Candidatus Omnitrophota bacterium]
MCADTRTPSHAARLMLMYFLRHHLRMLTYQEIADLFDLGHRSTALRSMRIIDEVEQLLPDLETKIHRSLNLTR